MFEKCGLRDVFVRIWKMKFIILVFVIIGAAVGSLMYVRKMSAYREMQEAEAAYDHVMYCGHAYYYINVTVGGSDTYAKMQSVVADSYKKIFALPSTSHEIFTALAKNHAEEELGGLLDAERYAEKQVSRYKLYGKSYGLRTIANKAVLEIRVCAETKEMCKELLLACRVKLKDIDATMTDNKLKFENKYIRKDVVDEKFFKGIYVTKENTAADTSSTGEATAVIEDDDADTSAETSAPGIGSIILWALIGLLAGIIVAIAAAIFVPTINRDSDFEGYGVVSFGTFGKDGAAMLARILKKKADERGVSGVTLVTTLKNNKKTEAFSGTLTTEAEAAGLHLTFVNQPATIAESSDACGSEDMFVALEKKGISRHQKFDEMKHYLKLMGKELDGAVLLT